MDDWPALKLISKLLADHRAGRPNEHQLVTTLHHDVEADVPLLRAAVERYGGQLYYLSEDDDAWNNPPGRISKTREQIVQGVLASVKDPLPGELELLEVKGHVTAGLKGKSASSVSPSLKALLRAIAVLVSDALEVAEITVLAVSVDDADATRRELLWRLLNHPPKDLGLTGARTIVAIMSSKPDPMLDFGRATPIRYLSLWDRVLLRADWSARSANKTFAEHDGPVVLFLGAGASSSARISLGNVYRDIALTELLGDSDDLPDAFFSYLQDQGRFIGDERLKRADFASSLTLERVLRETFHELGDRPREQTAIVKKITEECNQALSVSTRGRESLQKIIRNRTRPVVVITVNFDRLIEDGLSAAETTVLSTPEQFVSSREDVIKYLDGDISMPTPILKIHGSIEDPNSLVASIDTTSVGLHQDVRAVLDEIIERGKGPVPWIWVGCSMRDRDVNSWLTGVGNDRLDEWWVDPLPGVPLDEFITDHRQAAWSQTGRSIEERLIVDTSDRYLASLATHLGAT